VAETTTCLSTPERVELISSPITPESSHSLSEQDIQTTRRAKGNWHGAWGKGQGAKSEGRRAKGRFKVQSSRFHGL